MFTIIYVILLITLLVTVVITSEIIPWKTLFDSLTLLLFSIVGGLAIVLTILLITVLYTWAGLNLLKERTIVLIASFILLAYVGSSQSRLHHTSPWLVWAHRIIGMQYLGKMYLFHIGPIYVRNPNFILEGTRFTYSKWHPFMIVKHP